MNKARDASNVHFLEHSLVAAKMSVLRDKTTGTAQFRRALEQIAILLLTEASKNWPTLASRNRDSACPDDRRNPGAAGGIRANFARGPWLTRRNVARHTRGRSWSYRTLS